MGLTGWISEFRTLHDKARKGALQPDEARRYDQERDELATAMLGAQKIALRPGEAAHQVVRVPRVLQVELDDGRGRWRATTMEVWPGGFDALVSPPPEVGVVYHASLKLPGGVLISGDVRVTDVRKQPFTHRVSLAFLKLQQADREKLEHAVFDMLLEKLEQSAPRRS